jgi:hypothetical protein
MVTIVGYKLKSKAEGKPFIALELQGDVEVLQSQQTGKFYITSKKCNLPSTFDELTAKALVGTTLSGTIERVQADPYDFTIPQTGEVIKLNYRYEYIPEGYALVPNNQPTIEAERTEEIDALPVM